MRESLRDNYGVDLENEYNRVVTDAWNDAQRTVSCPKKSAYVALPWFSLLIQTI